MLNHPGVQICTAVVKLVLLSKSFCPSSGVGEGGEGGAGGAARKKCSPGHGGSELGLMLVPEGRAKVLLEPGDSLC